MVRRKMLFTRASQRNPLLWLAGSSCSTFAISKAPTVTCRLCGERFHLMLTQSNASRVLNRSKSTEKFWNAALHRATARALRRHLKYACKCAVEAMLVSKAGREQTGNGASTVAPLEQGDISADVVDLPQLADVLSIYAPETSGAPISWWLIAVNSSCDPSLVIDLINQAFAFPGSRRPNQLLILLSSTRADAEPLIAIFQAALCETMMKHHLSVRVVVSIPPLRLLLSQCEDDGRPQREVDELTTVAAAMMSIDPTPFKHHNNDSIVACITAISGDPLTRDTYVHLFGREFSVLSTSIFDSIGL